MLSTIGTGYATHNKPVPINLEAVFSTIETQQLYNDPTWLRLLHFRLTPRIATHSDVITPEFFLAHDNNAKQHKNTHNITPKAELYATLHAFYQPVSEGEDSNAHPQCLFPARFYWLKQKQLLPQENLPNVQCPRLQQWAKFSSLDSVSLIMVSGYFGNPASTFGHLMVKLNNSEYKASSGDLLDQSINYGAKVPENEATPVYIMKGIFGGYLSSFSDKKFYTQDLAYSKHEFRDMWEYELNLNDEQNHLLVYHLWEMLGKQSTYYFLNKNCGYRIAELLELVTGHPLTPNKQPWYLPISVFQKLTDIEQSRYIKKIRFLPSSQRKLHHAFNQLSKKEVIAVNTILDKPERLKTAVFDNFSTTQQSRMVDVMLDYYQYKIAGDSTEEEKTIFKRYKNTLIIQRLTLPIQHEKHQAPIPSLASPASGAKPRLFHIGLANNKKRGQVIEIGFTGIHYDTLSNSKGSLENSALKVFDLTLNYDKEQKLSLKKWDIINIQKLELSNTQLKGESNLSWRISMGLEQTDLSCVDCTNFYFKGGVGRAFKISDAFISYAMLDGKLITEKSTFETTPSIGFIVTLNKQLKSTVETGLKIDIKTGQKDEYAKMETRYSFSKNNTLRLSFEKFRGKEIKAAFYHHW
jgi:hypothetical protein